MNQSDLLRHATVVRRELLDVAGSPAHNCIFGSIVLAKRLSDAGARPVQIIRGAVHVGDHDDHQDHWWVEVGDLVIDITADQFNESVALGVKRFPPVVIAPRKSLRTHFRQAGVAPHAVRHGSSLSALLEEMISSDCRANCTSARWPKTVEWARKNIER